MSINPADYSECRAAVEWHEDMFRKRPRSIREYKKALEEGGVDKLIRDLENAILKMAHVANQGLLKPNFRFKSSLDAINQLNTNRFREYIVARVQDG